MILINSSQPDLSSHSQLQLKYRNAPIYLRSSAAAAAPQTEQFDPLKIFVNLNLICETKIKIGDMTSYYLPLRTALLAHSSSLELCTYNYYN